MKHDRRSAGCPTHSPEELARFLDGALPSGRQQRLRRHLQECAICRQRLRELEAVRTLLRQAPAVAPPRSLTLSERDATAGQRILWYPVLRSASMGLAVLVLLLFLVGALQVGWPGAAAPSPPAVAVDPMITRRATPTGVTQPGAMGLPTPAAAITVSAYPLPQTPRIGAGVTPPAVVAQTPGQPPADTVLWMALRLGALLLLGLCVAMTWLAYRRERVFLS